ncbi:MAG TPA: hypothetical protein VKB78_13475, partial [Pirellulales bacterium]|nr:hypothetical protein [Pirellulales bacterium]
LPVPAAADQKRIAAQFDRDFRAKASPEDERRVADQLFAMADESGTSADERYVALVKAIGLASKAGDIDSAMQGIDRLAAAYDIDPFAMKRQTIEDALKAGTSPERAAAALAAAEQSLEEAAEASKFDMALALCDSASKAAAKLASNSQSKKEAVERLARRRRDVAAMQTASAAAADAKSTLDKDPDNAEANVALGRWYCLFKRDWDRGLPLLAKGKDAALKSLAERELAVDLQLKPQLELADGWWEAGQKETGFARDSLHLHASEIYRLMLPNVQPGAKKTAIEKRLTEIADFKSTPASIATNAKAGTFRYAVNEYSWKLGQPTMQLIQSNRGFCFLAAVSGHFAGYGEAAGVYLGKDGFWSLDAQSQQDSLSTMAISIEDMKPTMFK